MLFAFFLARNAPPASSAPYCATQYALQVKTQTQHAPNVIVVVLFHSVVRSFFLSFKYGSTGKSRHIVHSTEELEEI